MHMAVQLDSFQILAYLLIDLKLNPNQLTEDETQQGILHMAISSNKPVFLDLII